MAVLTTKLATAPEMHLVHQAARLGRLDLLLAWANSASGVALRRFLIAEAVSAASVVDPGSLSADQLESAHELGISLSLDVSGSEEAPPHSVLVPFAIDGISVARRMLVSFSFEEEGDALSLHDDSVSAIAGALREAAVKASPAHPVDRYRFTMWKPGVEGELHISGRSLAPAVFVSAVSLWRDTHVIPGTAITGILAGTQMSAAGGLSEKIEGLSARSDFKRLVVAPGESEIARSLLGTHQRGDVTVVEASDLASLLRLSLADTPSSSLDVDDEMNKIRRDFDRAWETFRWPVLRERVERMAGSFVGQRPDLEVELWTMVGAARRHLGELDDGMRALTRAFEIAKQNELLVPDAPLIRLWTHHSMGALALGRMQEATKSAATALRIARRSRLRGEQIKALGCVGLVARARGRLRAAEKAQRDALVLVHEHKPNGCARSHAYLIACLGALHETEEARQIYDEGMDHLRGLEPLRARDHESWLRISLGGALVANGLMRQAAELLDVPCVQERIARDANPGLWARRYLGMALMHDPATVSRGVALLSASPGAYILPAASQLNMVASTNVLLEAQVRIAQNSVDDDLLTRVQNAMRWLPVPDRLRLDELRLRDGSVLAQLIKGLLARGV